MELPRQASNETPTGIMTGTSAQSLALIVHADLKEMLDVMKKKIAEETSSNSPFVPKSPRKIATSGTQQACRSPFPSMEPQCDSSNRYKYRRIWAVTWALP